MTVKLEIDDATAQLLQDSVDDSLRRHYVQNQPKLVKDLKAAAALVKSAREVAAPEPAEQVEPKPAEIYHHSKIHEMAQDLIEGIFDSALVFLIWYLCAAGNTARQANKVCSHLFGSEGGLRGNRVMRDFNNLTPWEKQAFLYEMLPFVEAYTTELCRSNARDARESGPPPLILADLEPVYGLTPQPKPAPVRMRPERGCIDCAHAVTEERDAVFAGRQVFRFCNSEALPHGLPPHPSVAPWYAGRHTANSPPWCPLQPYTDKRGSDPDVGYSG